MTRPPRVPVGAAADVPTLVHALEVQQSELLLQNHELTVANEALRSSNAELAVLRDRYAAIHALAPAPLVTVDPQGAILDVNLSSEAILNTPREHLIYRRFALLVVESARPTFRELVDELFGGGRVRGLELMLTPDGVPPIDVLIDGVVLDGGGGGPARAVLAFVDITAQKRAVEERRALDRRFEEAQRLQSLGVLAGGIAHDFNNLLTVVLGGTDIVLRGLDEGSPFVLPLSEARQAARQAGELAHQMLAFSGKVSAPARATDVGATLRDLEPLIRASAKATPLAMDLAEGLPAIVADEAQVRQLVLNLVINAAEAMHERAGAITIAVRAETLSPVRIARLQLAGELAPGPCVVLEVRDDGAGMDAAPQARIFEPYFSTKFVGRGLGLAVVQGIVRAHRGALAVASTVARGTMVSVYLPAVAVAAVARATERRVGSPDATEWRGTGTLLIVDDEAHLRRALTRIFESLGFVVLTAADGVEAIEVFRAGGARIDLVLMDLTMPRMGGVAAATAIHALRAEVPIVLVTGYGEIPAEAGSVFVAMLAKPFDLDGVRRVIEPLMPARAPVSL